MTDHIITSLDLTGLDEDSTRTIVRNILQGDYLEKPGVRGKGDAVLFMLVNEAIHVLESETEACLQEDA